jgi:hypothetical protein
MFSTPESVESRLSGLSAIFQVASWLTVTECLIVSALILICLLLRK